MIINTPEDMPKPPPPPAARQKDPDNHGAQVEIGSPNVSIEGLPAARVGDPVGPPCAKPIVKGSFTVFINGKPAARLGDQVGCSGTIVKGAARTFIGTGAPPGPSDFFMQCLAAAAEVGAGFIMNKVADKLMG